MKRVRDYKRKRIVYKSFLFDEINLQEGWAIPSIHFLEMWNSEKREAVARAGFTLIPVFEGEKRVGWKVLLPKAGGTAPIGKHIGNLVTADTADDAEKSDEQ